MSLDGCVDPRSNSIRNIDEEHALIHDGKLFSFSTVFTSLAAAGTKSTVFNVPAGSYPHLSFLVVADQPTLVELFTGTTATAGANVVGKNKNQASTITPGLGVDITATSITDGTAIYQQQVPAIADVGGTLRSNLEWILAPSTKYSLKVTNKHASTASNVSIEITWYELS